jgi:hypothetical protein
MLRWCAALSFAVLAFSLYGCSNRGEARSTLELSWTHMEEFPNTLIMRLENSGQRALCVPETDTREAIRVKQAGRDAELLEQSNRAVLQWKGAELIDGFVVIPPGKRVDIYPDLSVWLLREGDTSVSIMLPVFDCLEFFASGSPHPHYVRSSFRFNAEASSASH